MKSIQLFGVAIVALALSACGDTFGIRGNRHVVTQARPTADFKTVRADGSFEVDWRPGSTATVNIETDENLQEYVEVTNDGTELHLRSHNSLRPSHGIKAIVTSPTLNGVRLFGACRLNVSQLSADGFGMETAGASRVYLDGTVNRLVCEMNGASRLDAEALNARSAEMSLNGASRADVTVADSLRVSIAGAGKVTYGGDPKTVEKNISGAGKISRRE